MLATLRSNATRIIPRYTRTLSSSSDQTTPTDHPDIFTKLAGPDAPIKQISLLPASPPTSPLPIDAVASTEAPTDSVYLTIPPAQDPLLHYLASKITHHGMRTKAARRVSRVLMHIHGYTRAQPLPILRQAIFAASPAIRVAMNKKGAKNMATPMPLSEKQRTRYGVEWILQASEKKAGKSIDIRLAKEMIAVVQGNSEALKKKEEVHRLGMLNRYVLVYPNLNFLITLTLWRRGNALRSSR
jgi:small subunit ribosomal protein S7